MIFKKKADDRTLAVLNTAVIIVFVGILLTFGTIIGFTSEYDMKTEEGYYDNEEHERIFLEEFSTLFYKNKYFTKAIKKYEYSIYSQLSAANVIYGDDDFLFEVKNDDCGYDFWLDCAGKLMFSKDETENIAQNIKNDTTTLKSSGTEYYILMLPNAQTIYSEKIPFSYLITSGDTRRSVLLASLEFRGISNYIDPSSALERVSDSYILYNNTENSVTPLGAYFAYVEFCGKYYGKNNTANVIKQNSLHYQLHYTKGRDLAQMANLSDHIENLTVSLTDKMERNFTQKADTDTIHTINEKAPDQKKILISVTHDNDRSAFLYFFASTFGECIIESDENVTSEYIESTSPDIFLRIIHEDELSKLIG